METLEERNQPLSLGHKLAAIFLIGFAIYGVVYVIHYNSVKARSAYKFTLAEIVDDCVMNTVVGNLLEYSVNDEVFRFCKSEPDLRTMKKGDLLLIKFYIEDPSAFDLLTEKVPQGIVAPKGGWEDKPNF